MHKDFSQKNQKRLREFIESRFGIKMPDTKRQLLVNRLARRLRVLGFSTYDEYCDYIFDGEGTESEIVELINVVSTNKTDFFREPTTFDAMTGQLLPELEKDAGGRISRLKIWSAACSTGEEPYTIAMVLDRYFEKYKPDVKILGTDISTQALEKAFMAIYSKSVLDMIPAEYWNRHLMFPKDASKNLFRISPELRKQASYRRMNLMDPEYNADEDYDIIFCRNVLIYFENDVKEMIVSKLLKHVKKGGYFIIGTSESLLGMKSKLKHIQPGIYKKA